MRQKSMQPESPSERIEKNIRRATRKRHSSEENIRIVLDGLRGAGRASDGYRDGCGSGCSAGQSRLSLKLRGLLETTFQVLSAK
jgi:hypothetical protein